MTAEEIRASVNDLQATALTIMFEGASEPVEGRIAIASVIRNRVSKSKRFSFTYRGVCVQRAQFSCWWSFGGKDNFNRLMRAAEAMLTHQPVPFTNHESSIFLECHYIAEGVMGGQIRDRVQGATSYYAPLAMKPIGRVPKEVVGRPFIKVGSQIFYTVL